MNQSINQSFILTRYVKELKNSFKIRTCMDKIYSNYSYMILFNLNPTEQTCNTVGFRQFIVAYNTYLDKMVILTKYNLVENLGPNPKKWELKLRTSRRCRIVRKDGFA